MNAIGCWLLAIGYWAKTRLSELLRETEKGRSFRITRRGKVVARLMPASEQMVPATDLLAAFRADCQ